MARTRQQILQEINDAVVAQNVNGIFDEIQDGNTSGASLWQNIKQIIAFVIFNLENIFTSFENRITASINASQVGTLAWYGLTARGLQVQPQTIADRNAGTIDPVIIENGVVAYALDNPNNRIVSRAVAIELMDTITQGSSETMRPNGTIQIKVAKVDASKPVGFSPVGNVVTSNAENQLEGTSISTILSNAIIPFKPAGIKVQFINIQPQKITILEATDIQVDNNSINNDGQSPAGSYPVYDAIINYLQGLQFNQPFSLNALVCDINEVPGVVQVKSISLTITASTTDEPTGFTKQDTINLTYPGTDTIRMIDADAGYFDLTDNTQVQGAAYYTI